MVRPPAETLFSDALLSPAERHLTYVGGTAFDNLTMTEAVARILVMARQTDRARYVCTGNLDHLAILRHDAEFQCVYAEADMVLADGMPVVWLSGVRSREASVKGQNERPQTSMEPLRERVAGSDLFWEIAAASAKHGLRLFYLGGADGAAEEAARIMRVQYPGAQIVGTYCPPYQTFASDEEQANIRTRIHEAQPHILLVGLGAPKQEKWIYQHKDALGVPVSIGVGGTFEMAAGRVRRAPRWMQRGGLEWVFRLGQEPSRLWKRYLFRDVPFFFRLLTHPDSIDRRTPQQGTALSPMASANTEHSPDGMVSTGNNPTAAATRNGTQTPVGFQAEEGDSEAQVEARSNTQTTNRMR